MKLKKFFKLSIGVLFALPMSTFLGGELLANHTHESLGNDIFHENQLLACGGGGGGGGGGSKPGALKTKKLNSKLNFKKRQLSKAAAEGKDTTALQAEIKALESAISEAD